MSPKNKKKLDLIRIKLDKLDKDGTDLLKLIMKKNNAIPVIMISGHATVTVALESIRLGAYEFIEKPFDQTRLLNFIRRAVENISSKSQNKEYESKLFYSY